MRVDLISYTPDAARLLIFSKKTRLKMTPDAFQEVLEMPEEQVAEELKYVFGTIGSSWEFVDYVFLITGVSRAFTHQIVRHRIASFAQQAQRVVDVSDGFEFISTGKCKEDAGISTLYQSGMGDIRECYSRMVELGANVQDARGILPTNISTNILAKFNLRALSGVMNERLCFKAQGEFQEVAREMRKKVLEVHPWTKPVLQVNCVQYGTCKFPNFKECPIRVKGLIKEFDAQAIEDEWERTSLEVQPKGERWK